MTNVFTGKNILIFAPKFFGYEIEISKRMEELGAFVTLCDERPSNSFLTKVVIRLKPTLLKKRIISHYEKALNQNMKFDFVFFFKGETALPEVIDIVRNKLPESKVILYLIDSIANYPHLVSSLNKFDKVLSFDSQDSDCHKSIQFRPLFYLNDYSLIKNLQSEDKIDVLFIGTVHSDRWPFLEQIKKQAEQNGLSVYYYLYFQSPIIFYFKKVFDKNYKTIPIGAAKFRSISKFEILKLFEQAVAIVDIQHPKQTGLTMRSIEVFGANKKLITTNIRITQYDLYNPNNICLADRKQPILNIDFIKETNQHVTPKIYSKYSIDSWLKEIFSI